jgi:hypothetical protein
MDRADVHLRHIVHAAKFLTAPIEDAFFEFCCSLVRECEGGDIGGLRPHLSSFSIRRGDNLCFPDPAQAFDAAVLPGAARLAVLLTNAHTRQSQTKVPRAGGHPHGFLLLPIIYTINITQKDRRAFRYVREGGTWLQFYR